MGTELHFSILTDSPLPYTQFSGPTNFPGFNDTKCIPLVPKRWVQTDALTGRGNKAREGKDPQSAEKNY